MVDIVWLTALPYKTTLQPELRLVRHQSSALVNREHTCWQNLTRSCWLILKCYGDNMHCTLQMLQDMLSASQPDLEAFLTQVYSPQI